MLNNILTLRPSGSDWLFSFKTFLASILALYVALAFDLDRPVWAMATVYVVAHPMSGVLASKAVFRVIGTVLGAVAAIVMVPNLVNAPILLSAALAVWVGGCLFLARLDRTPRSYLFMLAGYTAAIIGFPCVTDPGNVFDTAIARFQEISLGIICATLVSHIVFPRHIGPVIAARINGWMGDIGKLAERSFNPDTDAVQLYNERTKIVADLGELHGLSLHLGYEKSDFSGRTSQLQALQSAVAALLPVFHGVHDRLVALKGERGDLPEPVKRLLNAIYDHISAEDHDHARTQSLHREVKAFARTVENSTDWAGLLQINLASRLHRLLDFHDDIRVLWDGIRVADVPADVVNRWKEGASNQAMHRDYGMAFRSGLTAVMATLVVCGFWIMSGWPSGATAATITAVAASIMSFLDNPVPALKSFVSYTALAVVVAIVYMLVILPGIDGFPLLAMSFAPYLILLGVLMASPQTYGFGLSLIVNVVMILDIDTAFSSNFSITLGNGIASLSGFGVAVVATALIRVVPVDSSIRRLLRANWREIAAIGRGTFGSSRMMVIRRLLDRQGLTLPRLAMSESHRDILIRAMPEVSIAASLYDLRRMKLFADQPVAARLDALLRNIARHYEARLEDFNRPPDLSILEEVDNILRHVISAPANAQRQKLLIQLVSLRRTISKADAPQLVRSSGDRKSGPGLPSVVGDIA